MKAAGVEYGHDECCVECPCSPCLSGDVKEGVSQGGGQSRLVSVGCWVFCSGNARQPSGLARVTPGVWEIALGIWA